MSGLRVLIWNLTCAAAVLASKQQGGVMLSSVNRQTNLSRESAMPRKKVDTI
jgi:hypothetical protein